MNINDINNRIKRIYSSIHKLIDKDTKKYIKKSESNNSISISFESDDLSNDENEIINMIYNLRHLKDHLKSSIPDIEKIIDNSEELRILADLGNADKHGYPVDKKRSKLDPKISDIRRGLGIDPENRKEFIELGNGGSTSNLVVFVDADILDGRNNKLYDFSKFIKEVCTQREKIIADSKIELQ